MSKVISRKHGIYLIVVCCVVYAIAYLGRLSFAASIRRISMEYPFSDEELGLVASFLFFAYGGGQLLNSFLAKYYNQRYTVAIALTVSAACNLLMALLENITLMQILWLINGLAQSLLWCNICNIQAKHLPKSLTSKCVTWGGFSYCFGTCAIYALSALLSQLHIAWQVCFYIVATLLILSAVWWFISVRFIEGAEKFDEEDAPSAVVTDTNKGFFTKRVIALICMVALFAIIIAFVRDGVITWLPKILSGVFDVQGSISDIITMGVSALSIVGILLAAFLTKRIKSHIVVMGLCFLAIGVVSLVSIFALNAGVVALFAPFVGLVIVMVYCCTNTITSRMPFAMKRYGSVGSLAALLDAFCYVGSSIATYSFAAIKDGYGWSAVFVVVVCVSVLGLIVAAIGRAVSVKSSISKDIF